MIKAAHKKFEKATDINKYGHEKASTNDTYTENNKQDKTCNNDSISRTCMNMFMLQYLQSTYKTYIYNMYTI